MLLLGYRFTLLENAESILLPLIVYQLVFSYPVHKLTRQVNEWAAQEGK